VIQSGLDPQLHRIRARECFSTARVFIDPAPHCVSRKNRETVTRGARGPIGDFWRMQGKVSGANIAELHGLWHQI
jgi:hypothetical protein